MSFILDSKVRREEHVKIPEVNVFYAIKRTKYLLEIDPVALLVMYPRLHSFPRKADETLANRALFRKRKGESFESFLQSSEKIILFTFKINAKHVTVKSMKIYQHEIKTHNHLPLQN